MDDDHWATWKDQDSGERVAGQDKHLRQSMKGRLPTVTGAIVRSQG